MKYQLPRFTPTEGEESREAKNQVNRFISANKVARYRDGSEGKVKPFKPRHYPAISIV